MITVLYREKDFRVSVMGSCLVVNFHGRYSKIFSPLVWSDTSMSEVSLMVREAKIMCSGYYSRLMTSVAKQQVSPVPEQVALHS